MTDPYQIEDSWNDGVKDRKRQRDDSLSAMLKTFVAVAQAIEGRDGRKGSRRIVKRS